MLHLKNLNKKYGTKKVLDTINVTVDHGSIAVFLGPSGVGKSTLLRVLNNLDELDSGFVLLDGKTLDLKTVNKEHTIGMVFQSFNLFDHLTVLQNVTLALENVLGKNKKEAETIAHKLLKKYGLQEQEKKFPKQLSGGQKQRLALVRILALKPKVICLDEPTSALDPILTTQVANTIEELAQQGYIVLIATHDTMLLEKLSCMIHLMKNGKIIESADSTHYFNKKSEFGQIDAFVRGSK